MKAQLATSRRVRRTAALSLFALMVWLPAPANAAQVSSGINCRLVSHSFAGSSGDSEYWDFKTKVTNNLSVKHRIYVYFLSPSTEVVQYHIGFYTRVAAYSSKTVKETIKVAAGNGWPNLKLNKCIIADP